MAHADGSGGERTYNEVAIDTANALAQARAALRDAQAGRERPRERLFPPHNRAGLGVALEYERMGNRPASPELQARADALGVRFEHLGLTLGTVLHDIDLTRSLSDEQVGFIRATLLERKVIFFRDQHLSEDEQVAFGRKFGELDAFPFGPPGDNPYILEIHHDAQRPGSENGWHTDVTWMERPSLGSIAQCVKLPPIGGDTLFSDSHACYLGLPSELQARIEHLHGINDYGVFLAGRSAGRLSDDLIAKIKQDIPFGVSHPLVRTHPETGKAGLYLNVAFLRHDSLYDARTDEPVGAAESEAIVRALSVQHSRPEYICRFRWEPGSIAFWDNRAVQHYAASDYYPHERILRRVTVRGDRPYYDPGAG